LNCNEIFQLHLNPIVQKISKNTLFLLFFLSVRAISGIRTHDHRVTGRVVYNCACAPVYLELKLVHVER